MKKTLTKVTSRSFLLQLMQIDLFATTPSLNYRKSRHYTLCGFLLTLLIVGFLGYTFVRQVYEAFTHYDFRSFDYFDGNNGMKMENFHVVCLEPQGSGVFPAGDYTRFIYGELHPKKTPVPIQTVEQTSTKLCVSLTEQLEIPEGQLFSFVIKESEFTNNGINGLRLTFQYPLLAVVDSQPYPVGYYPMVIKDKLDLTQPDQNIYFSMDVSGYWIDRGFLWATTNEHFALEYDRHSTTPDPRTFVPDGTDRNFGIHFGFSGRLSKTAITNNTLGLILSRVGGLHSSLIVICTLIFSNFMDCKYYENLLKRLVVRGYLNNDPSSDPKNDRGTSKDTKSFELKNLNDSEIRGINPQSLTKSKSEVKIKENDDTRISFWSFILYQTIIGQFLRRLFPKCLENVKQREQVEIVESWKKKFLLKLDVVEIIGKNLKAHENNRITAINSNISPTKSYNSPILLKDLKTNDNNKSAAIDLDSSSIQLENNPITVNSSPIKPANVNSQL